MVQIAVYRDDGASALSLVQLVKALRRLFPQADILRTTREGLLQGEWKKSQLLIFPGGRDLLYHQTLTGEPVEIVREWVLEGGRFWGICAGGYFGTSSVDLGIGDGNRVMSLRQMKLYPGTAIGPSLGNVPYDYLSQKECCVTPIKVAKELCYESGLESTSSSEELWAYYNTGCSFVLDVKKAGMPVRELAWYKDPRASEHPCAIVETFPGKGYALLSGVHPEFEARLMPQSEDIHMQRVIQELKAHQKQIDDLFLRLLKRALGEY